MKRAGKRLLSYLLVLAMLMSLYTPVYGADASVSAGAGTQAVEEEQQTGQKEPAAEEGIEDEGKEPASEGEDPQNVNDEAESQDEKNEVQDDENSPNADDVQTDSEVDVITEGEKAETETPSLVCNYIFTQEDDAHQSVIVEVGDQSSTILESAQITYQDGNGELHTADAEELAENIAAFLLELPQQGQERKFVSMKAVAGGQEYNISLSQEEEEMAQIEMGAEEVTQTITESQNEEAGLDAQTAEQVEKGVISADESGISSDDIKDAITENNQLGQAASNEIAAFSLGDDTDIPAAVSVEPKKKDHYIVVLDPGHGTVDKNGYDPGADHKFSDGTKFVEADLTMKIANYVKKELGKYSNITVYMTHDTVGASKAINMTLNERVDFAANKHADLLVSLHLNAFDYETAHGAEVLVPRTGRYNTEVAENAHKVANNILKRLVSLGLYDRGLKEQDSNDSVYPDGSKADYFAIIRGGQKAGIPAIIVEHAFLTGQADKKYLNNEASLKNLAKADAYGIAQYFGIETGGETYEPVPESKGEWRKVGGKYYYYVGGKKQTGWQKIDNVWYYLNRSGVMQTGWLNLGGTWYYLNSSGHMLTGWQKINGSYYYLNASGSMQTGWQKIDGKRYYLQSNGAMLEGGWHKIGSAWYYMSGNGAAAEGWISVGGSWYYMKPGSGKMCTGWYKVGKKWYYSNGSGAMQTGWLNLGGTWYYLLGNGARAEGWNAIGGAWYYLNPSDGKMRTGWYKVGKKWYYSNGSGAMQIGWLNLGGTWYFLSGNGAMAEGWIVVGSHWYYMNPSNGSMCTGWFKVNKKWYYCDGSGAMRTGWLNLGGTWYYLLGNGAMAEGWNYIGNGWYYLNPGNGAMRVGWFKANGRWYYCNGSGVMQSGWLNLGGTWYYLTGSGAMAEGFTTVGGAKYYLAPGNGAMLTGWYKVNNKWYYSNGSGAVQTGWLNLGGTWYYCDKNGVMKTGWITVGGKEYYLNGSGAWIPDAKKNDNSSSSNSGNSSTNTKNLYKIAGDSSVTVDQMVKYFKQSKCTYPSKDLSKGGAKDIKTFAKIVLEEANAEGIKAEVVFCQAMKETGWLQFGGDVSIKQFNFAGLGATGGGVKGNSFKDVRTGIRAQVQHLKAYASTAKLKNKCVDVRFEYVERNSAPYVEWLGIPDNPNGGGWAASENYGKDLVKMIKNLKKL